MAQEKLKIQDASGNVIESANWREDEHSWFIHDGVNEHGYDKTQWSRVLLPGKSAVRKASKKSKAK